MTKPGHAARSISSVLVAALLLASSVGCSWVCAESGAGDHVASAAAEAHTSPEPSAHCAQSGHAPAPAAPASDAPCPDESSCCACGERAVPSVAQLVELDRGDSVVGVASPAAQPRPDAPARLRLWMTRADRSPPRDVLALTTILLL